MAKERPPLEEMTLRQLRKVASEFGVSRYSRMRKSQLVVAIQEAQQAQAPSAPVSMPATSMPTSMPTPIPVVPTAAVEAQEEVEATKFEVGQDDLSAETLASVDEGLPDLPDGYGESRIVLMPRDPQWAYAYWDIPIEHKNELRSQGGSRLALRFCDVTDLNLDYQSPHSLQQYECDEMAREWYLPVPVSDRDYIVEIGYVCTDGRWLLLARSAIAHIPPVYPSDWIDDQYISVDWSEDLRGKTFMELVPPAKQMAGGAYMYDKIYDMAKDAEAQRMAGSLFGSMQHVPGSGVSSFIFPSGVGQWAEKSMSGAGMSMSGVGMGVGVGMGMGMTMSGAGLTMSGVGMGMSGVGMSGVGMSGIGMMGYGEYTMSGMGLNMSGVGFSASAPPIRPRKFWLIADAELIVYGATEPDATVTIGGQPIKLNPDGTFRFQMSFQDGLIDFPIMAVASDGEQNRAIHMKFERETPERRTNTKEDAVEEWLS